MLLNMSTPQVWGYSRGCSQLAHWLWRETSVHTSLPPNKSWRSQPVLTLMIWPRPGCSSGSGCSAPAHTPVQLIITSAPPLATWKQPTGKRVGSNEDPGVACLLFSPCSYSSGYLLWNHVRGPSGETGRDWFQILSLPIPNM